MLLGLAREDFHGVLLSEILNGYTKPPHLINSEMVLRTLGHEIFESQVLP